MIPVSIVVGEIKTRIGDGRIKILKEPAKFLKTYKPFLVKFSVIGKYLIALTLLNSD